MKKFLMILAGAALLLLLTGCDGGNTATDEGPAGATNVFHVKGKASGSIAVDPDTGVQYIVVATAYGIGIAPRLNPDGTPMLWEVDD